MALKPIRMTLGAKLFDVKTVTRDELYDQVKYWKNELATCRIEQISLYHYLIGMAFQIAELRGFEPYTDEELKAPYHPFG